MSNFKIMPIGRLLIESTSADRAILITDETPETGDLLDIATALGNPVVLDTPGMSSWLVDDGTAIQLLEAPENAEGFDSSNLVFVYGGRTKTIPNNGFETCEDLKSVDFPTVNSLGVSAFLNCSSLEWVSFPKVVTLPTGTFSGCSSLKSGYFPEVTTIGVESFQDAGDTSGSSLAFPKVTTVDTLAFLGAGFSSIDLPLAVTLGNNAFDSSALTEIDLPNVVSIPTQCFVDTTSLESVSAQKAVSIGVSAFAFSGIATVDLPLVTTVGTAAFSFAVDLGEITLPAATSIGEEAFAQCTGLYQVVLPALGTYLGPFAFQECEILEEVHLNMPLSAVQNTSFQDSSVDTIYIRPAPNTPAGWAFGDSQTIGGRSLSVAAWTSYPAPMP